MKEIARKSNAESIIQITIAQNKFFKKINFKMWQKLIL